MSDALLSIALAVIAASSLVNRWSLFFVGLAAGVGGTMFGIAGFLVGIYIRIGWQRYLVNILLCIYEHSSYLRQNQPVS